MEKINFIDLFDGFINGLSTDQNVKVDIIDSTEFIKIKAQLPGGSLKEEIQVSFDNQILTISGKIAVFNYSSSVRILLNEISPVTFKRAFKFKHNIDKDTLKARFENGILHIQMNKKESQKAFVIPVE